MMVCYSIIIEPFSLTSLNATDITYKSLAKSFNQKLAHHQETIRRMSAMYKNRKWVGTQNSEQLAATHRMALFPESAEVIYVEKDVWVVRKHPCSSSGDAAIKQAIPFSLWYDSKESYASFQEFQFYSRRCCMDSHPFFHFPQSMNGL